MTKEISGVFYNDPKMPSKDLAQVDILSKRECIEKWNEYVSAVSRHFMQMNCDEWPAKIVAAKTCWYHWQESWNNDNFL